MRSDIIYTKDTLIVNLSGRMSRKSIEKLRVRLYQIIKDYDIDNIVLNIRDITKFDNVVFNELLNDYYDNFSGEVKVKEA